MPIAVTPAGFTFELAGRTLIRHSADSPLAFAGRGEERIEMYRGNFDISDYLIERTPLAHADIEGARITLRRSAGDAPVLVLELEERAGNAIFHVRDAAPRVNRLWFRIAAEPDEHVWGCGEQMSYFDLRGRRFPLWTSEPGVGRDKSTHITWQADVTGHAGGDYCTTNYPQPTFLTSRRAAVHLETTAYSAFDFRHGAFHELEVWNVPQWLEFWAAPDYPSLVSAISHRFGRPPPLPDWATRGVIVGLKQGVRSFDLLERYIDAGVPVSGLWCEDWAGVRETSFGTRLFWDWRANAARYPDLDARIAGLATRGIRYLGYVNPYLCDDGTLFGEAESLGHFARDADGGTYRVDFGEFDCGVIDFTSAAACAWFAERVIGREMIGRGLGGWMADFGEYLPIDAQLASGASAKLMHNAWPTLWARVNAEAVAAAGRSGDIVFFMRAGFTGVQAHCPLLWAGDQSVDFSRHDGLQTVVPAALSSGLLGNPYHHSDIGGYTSLFGNVRTLELLQRWAEMAAFTPVMRTHEGNRPHDNLQFHDSPDAMAVLGRMARIHLHLAPYLRALVAEAATQGLPMQRPPLLGFPHDGRLGALHDHYLLGPDLLVAPVHAAGISEWRVVLPAGAEWVHIWSGVAHAGGTEPTVSASIGCPPAFFRAGTAFEPLFRDLAQL
ncbi:MAG TPA: alpha-glucosidase [Acetobacteraceae bacterium]|jgi:alpha-glucosidase|nr:alpha-glucosidase [Acetobacteraceae bacterium]